VSDSSTLPDRPIGANDDGISYNSAVYASISTNDYSVYLVNEAFLDDPECRNCTEKYSSDPYYSSRYKGLLSLWDQSRNNSLDRLEPAECIAQYATALQSYRRNVLLVIDSTQSDLPPQNRNLTYLNNTNTFWVGAFDALDGMDPGNAPDSYNWICSSLDYDSNSNCANRIGTIKSAPDSWKVGGACSSCNDVLWPVKYCLSERATPRCRLHFSPAIASVVTILNFCKCPERVILPFSIATKLQGRCLNLETRACRLTSLS
jgi:hypothetical protein